MKRNAISICLTLTLLLFAAACHKAEPNTANTNASSSNTASTNNAPATNSNHTAAAPETAPPSGSVSLATPTDTYKAAYAARKNKDIATLKRVFSKDALEFLTEIAGEDEKTLDDQLKELTAKPQAATDETRNEKINGNRASLEYLDEQGKWVVMEFNKEGNEWKIDLPKGP